MKLLFKDMLPFKQFKNYDASLLYCLLFGICFAASEKPVFQCKTQIACTIAVNCFVTLLLKVVYKYLMMVMMMILGVSIHMNW